MNLSDPKRLNPFPGLRPFRSDEHHLFFGREEQTAALLQLLRTNRFLAVVGTSGSGKSSLVRAGMIAELHGGTMTQAGSTWEVMILRPGGSPIENLARAFVEADLYDPQDLNTLPRLLATLNRSRFGLVEAMKQSEVFEPGTNLLVVVDQFEELFRFRQQSIDSEEVAAAFVNLLLTASEQAECPIYVTITMRSDYLGDCSEIPGLAEAVNDGEYLIPRLQRDQKRDAIEKPIGVGGAKISPLLVQRLLNDVGDDPDQLPVLQHALMRTWDAWSASGDGQRPIDFSDFEATGGLGAALSNHADEIYDSLPDNQHRSACEKIFKTLTVKGDDNRGIRRPTRLARLQAIAGANRETIVTVLDAFRRSGVTFLMPGAEATLGDRTVIDLSHESLMRCWERLRGWVEEEAQSARVFRRLLDTARLWGEGKAGLFRDPDLQIALSWREQENPNSDWAEQYGGHFKKAVDFLDASNAEAGAERQAREAARERELEQARQLAEAQQLRLEQQQRATKRLRKILAGLAFLAAIALVACGVALVANQRANRLAENARENAHQAELAAEETAKALATVASQKAEVEGSLTKAETAERLARAAEETGRKLLYTTDMRLAPFVWRDDRTTAEQLRVLLAKHVPQGEADRHAAPKPDLRGFEWRYYQHLLEQSAIVFAGHSAPVTDCAFTSAGEQVVTVDEKGQLRRWNLSSQVEDQSSRRQLPAGPETQNRALSPDGRLAALADGTKVHVFDASTGKETFQVESANVRFRHLAFAQGHDRLVILDDKIRWCNAENGEVIASSNENFTRVEALACSADGLTVAVVGHAYLGDHCSIYRLDPKTKTVTALAKDIGPGGTLAAGALSPDGQLVVVGAKLSGFMAAYDGATGRPIATLTSAHASPIAAMTFAGNGTLLATADTEGTIKIWADAHKLHPKAKALRTLKGHQDTVQSLGFSRDGKHLVSASADRSVRVWNVESSGASIHRLEGFSLAGYTVTSYSPDGQLIAGPVAANRLGLWDASSGRLVRTLSSDDSSPTFCLAFSPTDSRLLAVGHGGSSEASHVSLWDIDAGKELARLPGATDLPDFHLDDNTSAVSSLAFSPDGKYLVAGFGSRYLLTGQALRSPLKIWEVASRRLIRRLDGHTGFCVALAFSQDGKLLASGSHDGTAIVWSTATWKPVQTLRNSVPDEPLATQFMRRMVEDVAFSPDGKILAMASRHGSIPLWDVATGQLLATLKGHSSAVNNVVFSPDGRTLASGGNDQTVRLWNVETRQELMQLDPGSIELGPLRTLSFTLDGKQLLVGGVNVAAVWVAAPPIWNDPAQAADVLRRLLASNADFPSRVRMFSDHPRLPEALAKLDSKDARVQAALAATQASGHASRQAWSEATAAFDRLRAADPIHPDAWLRTPALLRVALALLSQNRPHDAALLLADGAKHRIQDGLDPAVNQVGIGLTYSQEDDAVRLNAPLPASPASRADLRPGDVLVKVNETALTRESAAKLSDLLAGPAGSKVRLTVRHPGKLETVEIELTREPFVHDSSAGEALHRLRTAIDERIAKKANDPGLLELRAELADQWSDAKAQAADYTAAIKALSQQQPAAKAADLQHLYSRRANASLALQQWQAALDDYARVGTEATTDENLRSNQVLAQAKVGLPGVPALFVRLGPQIESHGIYLVDVALDGVTEPADIDHSPCRLIQTATRGWGHAYFGIEKQLRWAPKMDTLVEIEYWTDTRGTITIQGDAPDHAYKQSPKVLHFNASRTWKTETFVLKGVRFANSQNGRADFRVVVNGTGHVYLRRVSLRQWFPGVDSNDPWVQLASRHRIKNEWEAIDRLVDSHPSSGLAVGNLLAEEKEWQRAIAIYSKAMSQGSHDPTLHSQRARAYEELKNWEAAAADWKRAATDTPEGAQLLADFGRRLMEQRQSSLAAAQRQMARTILEKALKSDPGNSLVAEQLIPILAEESRSLEAKGSGWTVLKPAEMSSKIAATMTIQDDGSILVSGNRSGNEIFTIVARPNLPTISGLRLEALPHPSLGGNGPGRHQSGWFKLSSLRAYQSWASRGKPPELIPCVNASASLESYDSNIAGTLDEELNVGWQNLGQIGKRQEAIFPFETPVASSADQSLTIKLFHNDDISFGCFRLSVARDLDIVRQAQIRLALANHKLSPWLRLGGAYALNGILDAAARLFEAEFKQADSYEDRKAIVQLAGVSDDLLAAFIKQHPEDPQLPLALARNQIARGKAAAAAGKPAAAVADFRQAQDIVTRLGNPVAHWTVPTPVEMQSTTGTKLELQKDGSIFAHQPPRNDTYAITFQTEMQGIKGLRLEALPDSRVPGGGPGWDGTGNFVLSELTLQTARAGATESSKPIRLRNASADFSQISNEGGDVRGAIDGDSRTGWAIWHKTNREHVAVFDLAEPVGDGKPTRVTVLLTHRYPSGKAHLARFRLSFTNDAATLQSARIRFDFKNEESLDFHLAFGQALSQEKQFNEALANFLRALELATTPAARNRIMAVAAAHDGMLTKLSEHEGSNAQLQTALARLASAHGQAALADAARARARQSLEQKLAKEPDNSASATELADLLLSESRAKWIVLKPSELKSAGGVTLTPLADHSILSSGKHPQRDDYTVVTPLNIKNLGAIALELLPDESHGESVGRGRDGQSIITQLNVSSLGRDGHPTPVPLTDAAADYEQLDATGFYSARTAIEGKSDWRGWAVSPQVKIPHRLVAKPGQPLAAGTAALTFVIGQHHFNQSHPQGLLVGRFRLSVSEDPQAFEQERDRLEAQKVSDPWGKLAAAYHTIGATAARDALLKRHVTAHAGMADLYAQAQDWKIALAEYDLAITPATTDAQLFAARAQVHEKLEHWELAASDWGNVDRFATTKTARYGNAGLTALEYRANVHGRLRQFDKQVGDYTELLEPARFGNNPWMFAGRGRALVQLRQHEQARADFDRAIKAASAADRATFQYFRGANWSAEIGQWKQAADELRQAYQQPTNSIKEWWAWRDAAFIYGIAGDVDNYRRAASECYATQFDTPLSWWDHHWMIMSMLLLPEMISSDQQARLLELAGKADGYWQPRMTAAIHFRCGDAKKAAELLAANHGGARFLFLEAMTHHHLGNHDRAKQLLHEGNAWVQEQSAKDPAAGVPPGQDWRDWAFIRVLQYEAYATMGGPGLALPTLPERPNGEGMFQAGLARLLAARGRAAAAEAARTHARVLLEKQLAAEPNNAAVATELAHLLWSTLPPADLYWIDDSTPPGARLQGDSPWEFVGKPDHPVFRGAKSMRRQAKGVSQHYLDGATPGLRIGPATKLLAYVYLDPKDPPRTVMLQFFNQAAGWEHRAFWGEDLMPFGAAGTPSRVAMGPLPRLGEWTRLEVDSAKVGLLPGASVRGWAFSQHGGTCYWDAAGITGTVQEPWQQLAAAYHHLGDQRAFDRVIAHHPEAATGPGDRLAASGDWEQALAEYRKLATERPADLALLSKLTQAFQTVGRTRDALPFIARASTAGPSDTILPLQVASLQAWFGDAKELAATRQRIRDFAKDAKDAITVERAVKACSLVPLDDKAEREALTSLIRRLLQLGPVGENGLWSQLAIGMAQYRIGNCPAAEDALRAAAQAGKEVPSVAGTAAYYRAMTQFAQGNREEARRLFITTALKMTPFPADLQNPLTNVTTLSAGDAQEFLITWLAYREARALLKIELSHIQMLEEARAEELKTLGAGHPGTAATTLKLVDAYTAAGRTPETLPLLEAVSAADPNDTILVLKVAALQAWFGQEKALAATRNRLLTWARDTTDSATAERVAKACSIRPSPSKTDLETAAALARLAVSRDPNQPWAHLALGMAEFRLGNAAAAKDALLTADRLGAQLPVLLAASGYYRAMSLFRLGKSDEARQVALATSARMSPYPKDARNPFVDGAYYDSLIVWLAYQEARTLIHFDTAPSPRAKNELQSR